MKVSYKMNEIYGVASRLETGMHIYWKIALSVS